MSLYCKYCSSLFRLCGWLFYLSLSWLISHKRMFEELICVGSLMIVLHQDCFYEVFELAAPSLRLQPRWNIPENKVLLQVLKNQCESLTWVWGRELSLDACHTGEAELQPSLSQWFPGTRDLKHWLRDALLCSDWLLLTWSVVIGSIWVLITSNHLGSHPVRCSNECVSSSNSSVQLSTHSEVHQLHLSIVCQQNILTFDISVDNLNTI